MTTTKSRAIRMARGFKRAWRDMDYAQRRMLEIRLGMPLEEVRVREPARAQINELESLFRRSPGS